MVKLSNKPDTASSVQYVDRVVHAPAPAPQVVEKTVYVNVPEVVEKIVEVPTVVEVQTPVNLEPLYANDNILKNKLVELGDYTNAQFKTVATELEMQRRALVSLKAQRDVDRTRRLQFIMRTKKQHAELKKTAKRLKIAIGACLLLSLMSFFIKF
jgi:Inner membrane complex protein